MVAIHSSGMEIASGFQSLTGWGNLGDYNLYET